MKNCLNCSNYTPKKDAMGYVRWNCKTMFAPMEKYKCHMSNDKTDKMENDIAIYALRQK